jgi:hypothetical protein
MINRIAISSAIQIALVSLASYLRLLFQQLVSSSFGGDGRILGTDLGDRGAPVDVV